MNRPNTPALFVPLAAMLAVAFPFVFGIHRFSPTVQQQDLTAKAKRHIARQSEASESTDKNKAKPLEKHDANKILREFFGLPENRHFSWSESNFPSGYSIDFVIATIPDPLDSRLPYLFDRFLTSIQRAAEADHLVLDRFDLPWSEGLEQKESIKKENEPSGDTASDTAVAHDFEKEPGLLLFRDPQGEDSSRLLVLFLVGETPTTGIHKEAFLAALNQVGGLWAFSKQTIPQIKILGPSFSGSAESMQIALRNWLAEPQHANEIAHGQQLTIQIVSGSATAIPTKSKPRENHSFYFDIPDRHTIVTFTTTVVPDDTELKQFYTYLTRDRGSVEPIRIGLLTEGNTAYGASLRRNPGGKTSQSGARKTSKSTTNALAKPCGTPSAPGEKPEDQNKTNEKVSVIPLSFPLHISRLRSESEKLRAQRIQAQQANQAQDSSKYLPMPFEDESEDAKDAIPPFSSLETSTSELMLANLLSTLSREHFDYVGIAATDVRDTIFLAREVREHSPSSVMFSMNADLLYTHPEASSNTRGMLVITPYPLFTLNQNWMDPSEGRPRLQFPDQNSEAVYNAMLVLLEAREGIGTQHCAQDCVGAQDQTLLEYGVPFWRFSIFDKAGSLGRNTDPLPEAFRKPAVWVTTVGSEGFWPVTVLFDRDKSDSTYARCSPPPQEFTEIPANWLRGTVPDSTILVLVLWSLLCGVPAVIFLYRETAKTVSAIRHRNRVQPFSAFPRVGDMEGRMVEFLFLWQ